MRKPVSSKGYGALLTANVDRYFVFILDLPVSQVCKNNALNVFLIAPLRNQLGLRILFVIPRTWLYRGSFYRGDTSVSSYNLAA